MSKSEERATLGLITPLIGKRNVRRIYVGAAVADPAMPIGTPTTTAR